MMIQQRIDGYVNGLWSHLTSGSDVPIERSHSLLRKALKGRQKRAYHSFRLGAYPLKVIQRLVCPLFPRNPDWKFLQARSGNDLIDIAFGLCEEILQWAGEGGPGNEGILPDDAFPVFTAAGVRGFHQQPCTPSTAIRRVQLVERAWRRSVPPSILLLGDDDLMSLAFALGPHWETTVIDLDPRVINVINVHSSGVRIKTIRHDLRCPLPPELQGRFDVVMADPMYTPDGIGQFVRAALQGLRGSGDRLFFLSLNERFCNETLLPLATEILERGGLSLIQHLERFNVYAVPKERTQQLRRAGKLFFSSPLLRTMVDIPITFSSMNIFSGSSRKDLSTWDLNSIS